MREIRKYVKTCSDEQLQAFIAHVEQQLDSADEDIRRMAHAARKLAREERAVRELLRPLRG